MGIELHDVIRLRLPLLFLATLLPGELTSLKAADKPRVIVTTDGEIDDECSMVRFLLYANEFDVEGIITSSSQYHWQGHKWAGDDWMRPYLNAYPLPDALRAITKQGGNRGRSPFRRARTDDAATALHASPKIVQNSAESAARRFS